MKTQKTFFCVPKIPKEFLRTTHFERALFFSWYCRIRDCAYCYMSTQPPRKKAVRSKESLLAELLICKKLGWEVGFISGGVGAFSQTKFLDLLKEMYKVNQEKFWLNVGPLDLKQLKKYLPYTKGVVGSIETVNPTIHQKVCPSKPVQPYFKMFEQALKLNLKTSLTIILGLGETLKDFLKLKRIIKKYQISKIHFYGLNPQPGTIFEKTSPPTTAYQAAWIKKTRQAFPRIDIQCGIWVDRVDRVAELLKAGANSISKFPALKKFGSPQAKEIETQAKLAHRKFQGSLTKLPKINWPKEIKNHNLNKAILTKVTQYLKTMNKPK